MKSFWVNSIVHRLAWSLTTAWYWLSSLSVIDFFVETICRDCDLTWCLKYRSILVALVAPWSCTLTVSSTPRCIMFGETMRHLMYKSTFTHNKYKSQQINEIHGNIYKTLPLLTIQTCLWHNFTYVGVCASTARIRKTTQTRGLTIFLSWCSICG